MEKSENELIQRAKAGDNQARSELYMTYSKLLYGYLYHSLGAAQDAEDICQETFLRAFKNLQSFQGKASFKNWLFQIAKHIIADHWKAHYKANTIYVEDFFDLADTTPSLTNTDNFRQLTQILDALSPEYRIILEYRFLRGYTLKEVARELDISVANAKVRQFRALKKAKQLVGNLNK